MDKIQDLISGRVTTDAVHRRFLSKKKNDSKNPGQNGNGEDNDFFYCVQCCKKISACDGKEELKTHFKTVEHTPYTNCVYCSKPVYEYKFSKQQEFYHMCRQD